ncbi:MAG: FtsQ-type POTRA domain-containing protein [Candidatus Hydrogenedentes bacterium]|nr:FtsQ-type POTRA domain-containing protein [Candidatus Hydrogenedentota bacterium]
MARAAKARYPAQRMARRTNARSVRAAFFTAFMLALFSTAALGLYQYVNDSEYFRVTTIQVDGAHLLRAADIVAAAGVSNQDNILFISPSAIAERVDANPYIKSCEVTRTLPDLVRISIEERYPVATLLAHNRAYEIDREMTVLRRLPPQEPNTGPLISQVAEMGAVDPGVQLVQAPLRVAIQVWEAFAETAMANEVTVSEIAAAGVNEIRMYCNELPFEIRWGRDDVRQQARNLDVLWRQRGPELPCTEYLDLRFGQDLACK